MNSIFYFRGTRYTSPAFLAKFKGNVPSKLKRLSSFSTGTIKFVDNINFKGWVLTVMRNIFINNYHKIVRTQTVVDQGVDLYNLDVVNDSGFDSPDGAYQIKEITKAINSLNDELKIPFSMFLSGYKYNEIAEKLCVPLGTVKSRIFFARQELQKVLKDFHRS